MRGVLNASSSDVDMRKGAMTGVWWRVSDTKSPTALRMRKNATIQGPSDADIITACRPKVQVSGSGSGLRTITQFSAATKNCVSFCGSEL